MIRVEKSQGPAHGSEGGGEARHLLADSFLLQDFWCWICGCPPNQGSRSAKKPPDGKIGECGHGFWETNQKKQHLKPKPYAAPISYLRIPFFRISGFRASARNPSLFREARPSTLGPRQQVLKSCDLLYDHVISPLTILTVLHYTTLYYTILHYATLHYATLYSTLR